MVGYSNRICVDETQDQGAEERFGQTFSKHSRCFESNLVKDLYVAGGASTRCFQFSCSSKGIVLINIDGATVWCPRNRAAGAADLNGLRGYEGSITCPAASVLGCEGTGELADGETLAPTPAPPQTPRPGSHPSTNPRAARVHPSPASDRPRYVHRPP